MCAFETPWFLKSKTTDVGRANQIVEERLQRSVTELEFKARQKLIKIDRRIDTVIDEYKTMKDDVDFSTDLDKHGKPLDPEVVRSKSSSENRSKRKIKKSLLKNEKGSQSANTGYKIRPRKEKKKFSTQELIEKLTQIRERERENEMREYDFTPQLKFPSRVHKLKPIEGITNKLTPDIPDEHIETDKTHNGEDVITLEDLIEGALKADHTDDVDLKLIGEVNEANSVSDEAQKKVKRRKKKNRKKDKNKG